MITIYHNPRCSKSREGLCYITSKTDMVTVIDYQKEGIDKATLIGILDKLNMTPIDVVRTKELKWKELLSTNPHPQDDLIIDWMVAFPQLIERPIVVKGDKAVIARPIEKIESLL